jgi:hypothetical protein
MKSLMSLFKKKPEPEYKQAARRSLKALEGVLYAVDLKDDEVKELWNVYDTMDVDKTGFVSVERFEMLMGVDSKPFMRRILLQFNFDNSGFFDFPEYLMMVWTYCTMDDHNLYIFLYDLIDVEKAGFIQGKDLEDLIRDVFGPDWKRIPEARLLIREVPLANMQLADVRKYFLFRTHLFKVFTDFREVMRKTAQPVDTIHFWQDLTRKKSSLRGDRLKNAMSLLRGVLKDMKPPMPVKPAPVVEVRKGTTRLFLPGLFLFSLSHPRCCIVCLWLSSQVRWWTAGPKTRFSRASTRKKRPYPRSTCFCTWNATSKRPAGRRRA